ncbi:phenylalanine--tRNA ligase subunit alpha [Candidatus Woesearchaeota archaeon]|nr:phenylalanine--tRNA ligase subunit alpha [Candidatus Woesearchaeota archaeon]
MEEPPMEEVLQKLHPLEIKVLPYLSTCKTAKEIVEKAKLEEVEVLRALHWLQSKKAIYLTSTVTEFLELGENGKAYLKRGMPEKNFLQKILGKQVQIQELQKVTGLTREEVQVSLGLLQHKQAIRIQDRKVQCTEKGKAFLQEETAEEKLLQKLALRPVPVQDLSKEEWQTMQQLRARKDFLRVVAQKTHAVEPTDFGKALLKQKIRVRNVIDQLTPELLREGKWKGKPYRKYDLQSKVPDIFGGRRHFEKEAIEYARSIWLEMGFREMSGDLVHPSFWNFDALFTAQDHPVREIQDTFFLQDPRKGALPEEKLVKAVQEMHEHGGKIGSRGWGGMWSKEEAKRNVLRTHTTVLSARTLAAIGKDTKTNLPAKYFSMGRCFRNEALDWNHLFEFNQTEGIVVDRNANFRHLLGYLKQFFKKMGFAQVRFRPGYFPYTEPSVEVDVFHPTHKQWVELGGAGIFRPEVVVPLLGEDIPVLAWGLGFARIIMDYYKITDIRDLYRNDVRQLRAMRSWLL